MSTISWTNETWNPVTGCDKVSPGCAHCYAEVMARRLKAMGQPNYRDGFKLTLQPGMLERPLGWKKPRLVFVNSMSDLFHDEVPEGYIWQIWAVMAACPQHTFQILTKRAERMREVLRSPAAEDLFEHACENLAGDKGWCHVDATYPLPNVWLGVSVENSRFEYRLDCLASTPAAVRFASFEPLLGPVCIGPGLDWGIVGGESGPGARRMDPLWALDLVTQLDLAGSKVFVKQLGSVLAAECGINDKGEDPERWPASLDRLKRREWPSVREAVLA